MDRNRDYDTSGNYGFGGYGTYTSGTDQDQYQGSNWERGQRFDRGNRWRNNSGQTGNWNQDMQSGMNRARGLHVNQGTGNFEWSEDQGFGGYGSGRYGQGSGYGMSGYNQGGYQGGYRSGRDDRDRGNWANRSFGTGNDTRNYTGDTSNAGERDYDTSYGTAYGTSGFGQGRGYGTGMGNRMTGQGYGGYGSQGSYGRTTVTPADTGTTMNRGQNWFGPHTGKGPGRSDERIADEICSRLTEHPHLDASNVDVVVQGGEVTLNGKVDSRQAKREAEQVADTVTGVRDVHNQLNIDESLLDKIENAFS